MQQVLHSSGDSGGHILSIKEVLTNNDVVGTFTMDKQSCFSDFGFKIRLIR